MLLFYVKWTLLSLLAVGVWAALTAGRRRTSASTWFTVVTGIGLVLTYIVGWIRRRTTRYLVTDRRIHIRTGLMSRSERTTHVDRVQNVHLSQNIAPAFARHRRRGLGHGRHRRLRQRFHVPRDRRPQRPRARRRPLLRGCGGSRDGPARALVACGRWTPPAASARSRSRFPQAREDHPFGPDAHVFKVGGGSTMFAILGDGPPVTITLKLTREEREVALEMPFVSEARYVGRYGWVTVRIEDEDCLEAALEWMRESYWLKAPRGRPRSRLGLYATSPPRASRARCRPGRCRPGSRAGCRGWPRCPG